MGTVLWQALVATAVIFLAGVGPSRWLLPRRRLGLWPYVALPVGFASLATTADLLVLFLPVQTFAWPLLAGLALLAVVSYRRTGEGTPWGRGGAVLVAGGALLALGLALMPALVEGRPVPFMVSNHDFFTYDVIADRLRAHAYLDIDETLPVLHENILEHIYLGYVYLSWRLGLVNVTAVVATTLNQPAYRVFGSILAAAYAAFPLVLATWAAVALRHRRGAALAAPVALLNGAAFYLVSEGFIAQLVALSLTVLFCALLVDALGRGERRALALASLVAAGWLCSFADAAVLLAATGVVVATGVSLAGERPHRRIWRDLVGCGIYAALFATWTVVRGLRAAAGTWMTRITYAEPFDESWPMPSLLEGTATLLGASADALNPVGAAGTPSTLELTVAIAGAGALIALGAGALRRPARIAAAGSIGLGVAMAGALGVITGVGYLVGKLLLSASCFAALFTAVAVSRLLGARSGQARRWGLGLLAAAGLGSLGVTTILGHHRRVERPITVTAEHEHLARIAARFPEEVQWVLLGNGIVASDVVHEHALVYLFSRAGRTLLFHPNEESYLAWPGEWLPRIRVDPERLAFAIEINERPVISAGEAIYELGPFRLRLLDANGLLGRWEFGDGWLGQERDHRGWFRWFREAGEVQAIGRVPTAFASLAFEARVPEGIQLLEVLAEDQPVSLVAVSSQWTPVETRPWVDRGLTTLHLRSWGEATEVDERSLSMAVRALEVRPRRVPPFSRLGAWRPGPGLGEVSGPATLRLWGPSQLILREGLRCARIDLEAPGVTARIGEDPELVTLYTGHTDIDLIPRRVPARVEGVSISWIDRCPMPSRFVIYLPPSLADGCADLGARIETSRPRNLELLMDGVPVRGPGRVTAGRHTVTWGPFALRQTMEVELPGGSLSLLGGGINLNLSRCGISTRPSIWSDAWSERERVDGALVRWAEAGIDNAIVSIQVSSDVPCLSLRADVYCPPELAGTPLALATAPTPARGYVRGGSILHPGWNRVVTEPFPLERPTNVVFVAHPEPGVSGRFGVGSIEVVVEACPGTGEQSSPETNEGD